MYETDEDNFTETVPCPSCLADVVIPVYDTDCHCFHCSFRWRMLLKPIEGTRDVEAFEGDFFNLSADEQEKIIRYSNLNPVNKTFTGDSHFAAQKRFFKKFDAEMSAYSDDTPYEEEPSLRTLTKGWMHDEKTIEEDEPLHVGEKELEPKESNNSLGKIIKYNGIEVSFTEITRILKDSPPLRNTGAGSYIFPLDYFKENISDFDKFSSMIDLDNEIVFIGISHREFMENIFEVSDINYPDDFGAMNRYFHQLFNMIEISTGTNTYITSGYTKTIEEFKLTIPNYDFSHMDSLTILERLSNFVTIHAQDKSQTIEGTIYFPKVDDDNVRENAFIVIPEASEDYILPSLKLSGYKGCVIAEKGSRASHLASLSKDVKFNMILMPEASKRLSKGDVLSLDFETKTYSINVE